MHLPLKVAYLPFQLELSHDVKAGTEQYLVTRLVTGFSAPGFGPGAEVTHWNGIPIAWAVALNGLQFAGCNTAASLAHGLESLTLRPLVIQLPPDEDWVSVSYLGTDGTTQELREPWRVADRPPPMADADAVSVAATSQGLDLEDDEKSRASGGHIHAGEFILQTLTPRRIVPEPVQFIGTVLNTAICRRHATNPTGKLDLGPWPASLEQTVETGSVFSATRDDLLAGKVDLLERAAQLLADLAVDGRPRASIELGAAPETATVPGVTPGQRLRVEGYAAGQLVTAHTVTV